MKLTSLLLLILLSITASAQKLVRTYYDPEKQKLKEEYAVSKTDNSIISGKYKSYYENGKLMVEGNFDDGEKSGSFTEYHENGTPARRFNYVNGLRHGVVEVFDDDGKPIQKAFYQNDILTDSVQLYFASGSKKGETNF